MDDFNTHNLVTIVAFIYSQNLMICLTDSFYEQDGIKLGVVCVFSLKNASYPEYVCYAPCGIMSVDIHPTHPHMLVVGLANGNVAVYNLQLQGKKPAYLSSARNGKHTDIVWQVNHLLGNDF